MTTSPEVVELVTTLGLRSALVVPSTAREEGAAALALVRGPDRPPFTSDDLADVADLGERTAIAIDNLRLYARARSISIGLQKALLTPLPTPPGLQLASRYEPGANGSAIGGDWYDAFDQPDGTTVVVVGDVVGHDLDAAAAMGHLRGVIRTIGHTTSATPAQTLRRADRAAVGLQVRAVASAVVAGLREVGPDVFTLQWSCAGHPPPLLVRRTGEVVVLSGTSDVLLGVSPERERRQFEVPMHRGDTLVLYTDGLVERRDEGLEDGIARLAEHLAGTAGIPLSELCERAVGGRPPGNDDDLAMLVVRIGSSDSG
jgi:serine phosphatase RsbU (regulator of sigma subunit)